MKQTAIEWFLDKIKNSRPVDQNEMNELIQKALEMDKENIIDAFDTGRRKGDWIFDGEKYYNETFKNETK